MGQLNNPVLKRVLRLARLTRRKIYALRMLVPGLRERHQLERMVGPLGFWDKLQNYHLNVLVTNGLQTSHSLLDIGCGPLLGGGASIRYLDAGQYTGIDIDPKRIDAAHLQTARHELSSKNPRLVVSATFGEEELGSTSYDVMWASQILYYFDEAAMTRLLRMASNRLRPGGFLLGDTYALDHDEWINPTDPAGPCTRHTLESLSAIAGPFGLEVKLLGTIGDFGYPDALTLRTNPLYIFRKPTT